MHGYRYYYTLHVSLLLPPCGCKKETPTSHCIALLWHCLKCMGKHPRYLVETLLALYGISGCDTCSSPYNKGKRMCASVALSLIGSIPNNARFGLSAELLVSECVFTEARTFFALLYGKNHQFDTMAVLRQHVFASGRPDLRCLPPTEYASSLYIKHCLYQLTLYQSARASDLSLPPQLIMEV